jgi:hypothetical protein
VQGNFNKENVQACNVLIEFSTTQKELIANNAMTRFIDQSTSLTTGT